MNLHNVKEVLKLSMEVAELAKGLERDHRLHLHNKQTYDKKMEEYRCNPDAPRPYLIESDPLFGSKQSAALRRRSMDLTRALADLRR